MMLKPKKQQEQDWKSRKKDNTTEEGQTNAEWVNKLVPRRVLLNATEVECKKLAWMCKVSLQTWSRMLLKIILSDKHADQEKHPESDHIKWEKRLKQMCKNKQNFR